VKKREKIARGLIISTGVISIAVGLISLLALETSKSLILLWGGLFFLVMGVGLILSETAWPMDRFERMVLRDDISEEEAEARLKRFRRTGFKLLVSAIFGVATWMLLGTAYFLGMIPELLFEVAVPIVLAVYILLIVLIIKFT
jgi:hypothetical protein